MFSPKPLLLCQRGKGSAVTGLGKGEGLSSSYEQWVPILGCGGTEHHAYCRSGQGLSAVAEGRGKVLQAGQVCSSPLPPPACSHGMCTIIKMPVL